jgi:hypothetical protein
MMASAIGLGVVLAGHPCTETVYHRGNQNRSTFT